MFVYNETRVSGGCWDLVYLYNTNTTYASMWNLSMGAGYLANSVVYRYQLLFQMNDYEVTPLNNVSNVVATTKTMLTDVEFDPFGGIFYYNTTGTVNAGARIGGTNMLFASSGVDLRYTFNCGSTLTAYMPLYLKVRMQSNGKVKLASTSPWAQELPTSADGYYYIYLGRAYSTYQMSLEKDHPIYYHNGVELKQLLKQNISNATGAYDGLMSKWDKLKLDALSSDANTVNGHTVNADVPSDAKFTDTTYESKAAASGGTAVSLVTTGEKYTWNNKGTYSKPSGGIPDSDIASAATWNAKGNGTITGITMNGSSKGTSGVVDLGTVITAHQDISGKADKSATVSTVAYDSTNKKITKTINGTTSDVVTASTLKTAMALNNVENKSSATIRGELTKSNVTTALGYAPPSINTTYTANTSKLVTTTVPNITSVGSATKLGTAISASHITAWTSNTPTAFTVSGEKLSITTGSAATLSYDSKTIPNVTSAGTAPTLGTAITVATGSLAANGSGGTVATGITGS